MPLSRLADPALFKTSAYLNGQWEPGQSTFDVHNPATGARVASVANLGPAHVQLAIDAANAAWPAWRALSAKERAGILRKWFDLIIKHADDLALIMTTEQGKPMAEARGEAVYAASFVEWFAEQGKRVMGDVLESPRADTRMMVLREPVGVVAAITPWNFPAAMITRKVAPALAAGCPVVIKPAELTPLTALALAELAHRAGVPAGVLNVLTADSANSIAIGGVLCASPVVRKLSFTGSTEVGRILMRQSADTVKKLSLELGGNAPFIVFDDADLDAAVEGAIASKYRNAGQTCVCANRIYVQAGVYDEFAQRFTARVKQMKVGNGADAGVEIGPLIEPAALEKVQLHVSDALSKGAQVLTGGGLYKATPDQTNIGSGQFYEPTVLANVTQDMRIAREETFGPVAPLFKFDTDEDAIRMANDTEFGLASYFYSNNLRRVWRVAQALEYGMVGINTGIIGNEVGPFGGVKQSGLGREGSVHGIEDFLEMKYLCIGGIGATNSAI